MQNQTREIIESCFEKSKDKFPPEMHQQLKNALIKKFEKGQPLKEGLDISDEILDIFYGHAYNLYQAGKYRQALRIFSFLRQLNEADPRYSMALAACYHYLGEYNNAIVNYYFCKEVDFFNPVPSFHLYDCYMKLDKPKAALEALADVVARCGDEPKYQELKEKALLEKNNLVEQLKKHLREKTGS